MVHTHMDAPLHPHSSSSVCLLFLTLEALWASEAASPSAASSSSVSACDKPWRMFLQRGERDGRHVQMAKQLAQSVSSGTSPLSSSSALQYRDWSQQHHYRVWQAAMAVDTPCPCSCSGRPCSCASRCCDHSCVTCSCSSHPCDHPCSLGPRACAGGSWIHG